MELTQVAIAVTTHVIVNTIGNIAGLLDLCNHHTGANTMNSTCGNVEAVTLNNVYLVQVVLNATVCYLLGIVGYISSFGKSGNQLATAVGIYYVPHLVLSHLVVTLLAQLVIGMNLNREVLTRIYELDEQGEVLSELLGIFLAQEVGTIAFYYLRQCKTFVFAIQNY